MNRFILLLSVFCLYQCDTHEEVAVKLAPELSIEDIHRGYQQNDFTITDVVQFYLNRIDSLDANGPGLKSILHLNSEALEIARILDEEGPGNRPLYGIPVVLKDNMDTGDGMPCTAGSRVMRHNIPKNDCSIARQLREAGAVILGKANLSEWANFHSYGSSSGWSGLGGQTKNPYRLSHNPCGSSAGSAVAVSANLTTVAIGTETNGSIICPANNNGIVGIKPTVGLISRRGIIPISDRQDTGGPMARTVRDATIVLGALTQIDSLDHIMLNEDRKSFTDYTQFLNKDGLLNKRVGYYAKPLQDDTTTLSKVMQHNLDLLESTGAQLFSIDSILHHRTGINSFIAMKYEFTTGVNEYLSKKSSSQIPANLNEAIELTFEDSVEMIFNHQLMKDAAQSIDTSDEKYLLARDSAALLAQLLGMDRIMDSLRLDAIVAPSGSPAWPTNHETGDRFGVYSSSPAAIAGYPNISVPMGQVDGLPVGMSIFGRAWSEPTLIEIAYAFEQLSQARTPPQFLSK